MLTEKFYEIIKHEGIFTIMSWGAHPEPNMAHTWNSYLIITDDEKILLPAGGFKATEENVAVNDQVLIALGSKEVEGKNGYQGTGLHLYATASFVTEGENFEKIKERFSWARSAMELSVTSVKQLL